MVPQSCFCALLLVSVRGRKGDKGRVEEATQEKESGRRLLIKAARSSPEALSAVSLSDSR